MIAPFTPGPWVVYITQFNDTVIRVGRSSKFIAEVSHGSGATAKANVRLMAAVPDLHAALARCREVYGKYGALVSEPGDPGRLIAQIDAALAKAKGENHG